MTSIERIVAAVDELVAHVVESRDVDELVTRLRSTCAATDDGRWAIDLGAGPIERLVVDDWAHEPVAVIDLELRDGRDDAAALIDGLGLDRRRALPGGGLSSAAETTVGETVISISALSERDRLLGLSLTRFEPR
ncbi:MAG: hypothetical protein AAFZ07_22805 [Actinomycetota bacterium]